MQNPRSIKELLKGAGGRLTHLKARAQARSLVLDHVRAALPPAMAAAVVSAGVEDGCLTIGAAGAPWAARLRYATEKLRLQVGAAAAVEIRSVRIRVVPPRSA